MTKTVYAVRSLPLRNSDGKILGWARVGLATDVPDELRALESYEVIYLRDGNYLTQGDLATLDPALLFATAEEAEKDGLARLRSEAYR